MSSEPKISVCIVAYNQERYIADCILSVIAQRVDMPMEILVGNDCSTDATGEIVDALCDRYPAIIRCHHHVSNLGPSGNLRFLIERANGEFVATLDGDDMWLPGKLATQLKFLGDNPSCVAVFANASVINERGELTGAFNNRQPAILDLGYVLRRGNFLNHSSRLYRRSAGSFLLHTNTDFIDYYMTLMLAAQGSIGYLNECLAVYRMGVSNSMTNAAPRKVQTLYWNALALADLRSANKGCVIGAVSNFWAQILNRARTDRSLSYAVSWAKCIRQEMPDIATKALVWGSLDFARFLFRRTWLRMPILSRKRRMPVWFYR